MTSSGKEGCKFSAATARRVIALLARRGVCTVADISNELSISKMTVGRVLSKFYSERTVRRLAYRPISGRGAKPARYTLHPKTSVAVLDLRAGNYALRVFSVPAFKESSLVPKIRSDRPDSDKLLLLRDECLPLLFASGREKHLLALAVLTDGEIPEQFMPEALPLGAFYFTEDDVIRSHINDETITPSECTENDATLFAARLSIDLYEKGQQEET